MKRKNLSAGQRFKILKRDNFTCQYCGAKAPDVELQIDHIIPVCKGGTNDIVNLTTACKSCNMRKSGNDYLYPEAKSQRVQLTMQPSLISKAKVAAEGESISLNEFIHRAIIEKLNGGDANA